MTLGTNNKKSIYWLAGLSVLAAYSVYTNLLAGPDLPPASSSSAERPAAAPVSPASLPSPGTRPVTRPSTKNRARNAEFHPALRRARDEQAPDPASIDPTLQEWRFKKVQEVELASAAGSRNLFQFGQPPPPKPTETKPNGPGPKVYPIYDRPQAPRVPPPPPPPIPPPPPPPIPLKFYAFWVAKDSGKRTACFLTSKEEIVMAGEGETVERRYRVVRITPTSVVMEDLDVKKEQTLRLVEEAQGE